jgi:PEGA domain
VSGGPVPGRPGESPFRWPPEGADFETIELEPPARSANYLPSEAAPTFSESSSASIFREAPSALREAPSAALFRKPARPAAQDFLELRAAVAEKASTPHLPPTQPASSAPPAPSLPSMWREFAKRWLLLLCAGLVILESGWLLGERAGYRPQQVREAAVAQAPAVAAPVSAPANVPPLPSPVIAPAGAIAAASPSLQTPALVQPSAPIVPAVPEPHAAPAVPARPQVGTLVAPLPIQLEVYENGRFIGLNDSGRLSLSPGTHQVEFVNDSLHYRVFQRVVIRAGQATTVRPILPMGRLQMNAVPWAEVFIDGRTVGQTPLGNVGVPIGPHEIVFRHPQLGEQTQSVVVQADTTSRLSVDFRK